MQQGSIENFEMLFGYLPVGAVVLDSLDLHIRYLNGYLATQLEKYWTHGEVLGKQVTEFLPENVREIVLGYLNSVTVSKQVIEYAQVPYDGFLYTRGRTYWHVIMQKGPVGTDKTLLILLEDVTEKVRSRLLLSAIHSVSSAIIGTYTLPLVLDRVLSSVYELVSATHCAILLVEQASKGSYNERNISTFRRATLAAQRGVAKAFHDWRPVINEQLLLYRAERERHPLAVADTATIPEINLPSLDASGVPVQPGSVLCVPIFEPYTLEESATTLLMASPQSKAALGSIEVYHRRVRGFAGEEVLLLEQFAQQAGLAIQNTRLLSTSSQLARAERRSARQQKYVMQAIPDGVIIFDPRWRIAEINQAIRMLFGWSDSVLGQTILQAFHASNATLYYDIVRYPDPIPELERRARAGVIDEFKMIGADGQAYTIRCTYTPIRDDLGDIFAFVVIYHNVTEQTAVRERVEAEVVERTRELAQRNDELKALEQAREDFFTTIAHELKTPLANIRASLSALLTSDLSWSREEQHTSLLTTDEQAKRLESMVNHILNASRVEAGALRLELEAVLLPELFEDLEERLRALIVSSKRRLHIKYPDTLPAVRADYERLISVLTNLLSNAFRYAPEGDTVLLEAEPVFAVSSTESPYPTGVKLYVIDRGPGISQEQQRLLFTRFSTFSAIKQQESSSIEQASGEQRQATSRWSSTTGLGLYISRGIVEAHGSELTLESEPGQGANFSFTLPVYETIE